jgi:hypothetical protein
MNLPSRFTPDTAKVVILGEQTISAWLNGSGKELFDRFRLLHLAT